MGWLVAGGAVVLVALLLVVLYNRLVFLRNQVTQAFASIDVMLKKRHDLIPNLVGAVRGFMSHEKGLLEEITALRARAISGGLSPAERIEVEGKISKALSGIMVAVENYPALRSNENVLQLQASLNEVEEQISATRRFYNAAVTSYNTAIQSFPAVLAAGALGFRESKVFEIGETERGVPDVGRLMQGGA